MIADPVGAPGLGAFPESPKGDPGGIEGAAGRLEQAGQALQHVEAGLRGSAEGLADDWNGDAAGAYRAAAQGLGATARAAAATFADCAQAARRYGRALQDCQQRLDQLRKAFNDALARESTAAGRIESLMVAAQAPHAPPSVATDLASAQTAQGDAIGDAQRILRRAHDVLARFHEAERSAVGTLSGEHAGGPGGLGGPFAPGFGQAPGVGTGLGPGFGIPQGGLAPFDGTIRVGDPWNSSVPGIGMYWDHTHPEVEATDDLTNVILFAAGGVGAIGIDTLRMGARELAEAGARQFGLVSERKVAGEASAAAREEALALGRNGPQRAKSFISRLADSNEAGDRAAARAATELKARRADSLERGLDIGEKLGLKLPAGVKEAVTHLYRLSDQYRYYVMLKLTEIRDAAATHGAAGAAVAKAIDHFLGTGRR